jgi:hypothetical protein
MNNEQTFWFNFWRLVVVLILGIAATAASCTGYQSYKVSEIQSRGADPIAAHCAIHATSERRTICDAYVAKGKP